MELTNRDEQQPQCWLIHPSDSDDRNRVYFSIRDVYLPLGKQLKVIFPEAAKNLPGILRKMLLARESSVSVGISKNSKKFA